MIFNLTIIKKNIGHRNIIWMLLCLFLLGILPSSAVYQKGKKKKVVDERVYLIHSDELRFDQYSNNPDAQIVKGNVHFRHRGADLWCDSAYFYQMTNSVRAFGNVRLKQGDTLSLTCERAFYDGQSMQLEARSKVNRVKLKHHNRLLTTDSLNYDRLYNYAYFFEGGELTEGKDRLVADWGKYSLDTKKAEFYYSVKMSSDGQLIETDTLFYDTRLSRAQVAGPSTITSKGSVIHTANAFFDTKSDLAELYGRSTVVDKEKTITGDSLFFNDKTGESKGFGNVIYHDKKNQNSLYCDYLVYNEKTGNGFATKRVVAKDYSQKDTLYVHADTIRIKTFHINTDSVSREVHCYRKVRAFRTDIQAVCDSMVIHSKDSCLTMYQDPIVWNGTRQLLGEEIKVYMADSTIRHAQVLRQALSVEQLPDSIHFNQISSENMYAYFTEGVLRRCDAIKGVKTIYYSADDKDSTLIGLNYLETDTMRMYLSRERQLEKIWTCRFQSTLYPMGQIPPGKTMLPTYAWFDYIRPVNKDDIMNWRGKAAGSELKEIKRTAPPLKKLSGAASPSIVVTTPQKGSESAQKKKG